MTEYHEQVNEEFEQAWQVFRMRLIELKERMGVRDIANLVDLRGLSIATISKIINDPDYRLSDPSLIADVGLPPRYLTCRMCHKLDEYVRSGQTRRRKEIRWRDLSTTRLKLALIYREEVI